MQLIAGKMNTTYGSEIVLLTDGEDSGMAACLDMVKQSGAKIHTIALGPSAAKELEEFSKLTGKYSKCTLSLACILKHENVKAWQFIGLENKKFKTNLILQKFGFHNRLF